MTLYGGIDLHSNNVVISLINDADQLISEKPIPNDLTLIHSHLTPFKSDVSALVVESTYNWYWLVDALQEDGFDVRLANTVAIKQYEGIKHTNDATDARYLAQLLRLGILPEGHIYPKEQRAVRDLLRRRLLLVRQRVTQHLSLQSLIARHSGTRLPALKIKQLTSESLANYLVQPAALASARIFNEQMHSLTDSIKKIELVVGNQCLATRDYQLLNSIPGVGPILGQTILLETGAINRFSNVGNYASYARCVPSERISNGKVKGRGNRKNGNRYLALAFFEAGHYASIWDQNIKRYYQRKLTKVPKMVAKKTIANKLARATYHMLKNNELFDVTRAFR